MQKAINWNPVIHKFRKKLSSWKAHNLSYGGRLTLIKSVLGNLATYYFSSFKAPLKVINTLESMRRTFFWGGSLDGSKMAWIAWKKVCSTRKRGGLGIGSLLAANIAMITKWWWRFYTEPDSLWRSIIISIHGGQCGLGHCPFPNSGTWGRIVNADSSISKHGINLKSLFAWKLGNGQDIPFWQTTWNDNGEPLMLKYPNLYCLDRYPNSPVSDRLHRHTHEGPIIFSWAWKRSLRAGLETSLLMDLQNLIGHVNLSSNPDTKIFSPSPDGIYSVQCLRNYIDNLYTGKKVLYPHLGTDLHLLNSTSICGGYLVIGCQLDSISWTGTSTSIPLGVPFVTKTSNLPNTYLLIVLFPLASGPCSQTGGTFNTQLTAPSWAS